MHIGILTDEFVTELADAGGLARYADRMSRALVAEGHEVEVFTRGEPGVLEREGVRIVRIDESEPLPISALGLIGAWNWRVAFPRVQTALKIAWAMWRAVHERHRERPFDFVQSANTSASGLFVGRRLRHVVRLSSARDLWFHTDRVVRRDNRHDLHALARLERLAMRRASAVYAPSRFLADYFERVHDLHVGVVRPPLAVDDEVGHFDGELPPRYLIHFGSLMRRKGTDLVAGALTLAWRDEPDLTMVWAGRELEAGIVRHCRAQWSDAQNERLICLGPLPRPELSAVLRGAAAAVLPSRVDNLPNTLIESLAAGVGVIGSQGGSIDELVEPGRSGELVRVGDVEALAEMMVRAWRGDLDWQGAFELPEVMRGYDARAAARALVEYARGD